MFWTSPLKNQFNQRQIYFEHHYQLLFNQKKQIVGFTMTGYVQYACILINHDENDKFLYFYLIFYGVMLYQTHSTEVYDRIIVKTVFKSNEAKV